MDVKIQNDNKVNQTYKDISGDYCLAPASGRPQGTVLCYR